MHLARATFYGNVQEKCQNRDTYFARACAIEMHIDIAQSHFYARMYNKNSGHQRAYPDLTPLYDLPPEPLSVDTLLGKKGDLSLQLNEAGHLRVGLLNCVGWAPSPIPCVPEDAWLNSRSKSTMRKFNPLETFTNI